MASRRLNAHYWRCLCRVCGEDFESKREHAKTCSDKCRKRLHRNQGLSLVTPEKAIPLGFDWDRARKEKEESQPSA